MHIHRLNLDFKLSPRWSFSVSTPSSPFPLCEAQRSAGHVFIGFFLLFSFFVRFSHHKTLNRRTCVKYFFFLCLFAFSILWAFCLQPPPSALHLKTLRYTVAKALHYYTTLCCDGPLLELAFTVICSALASFFRWTGEKEKKALKFTSELC